MKESDVSSYNTIALEINAPIYAYYADQIIEKTGIATGICLDVGCGGGYLGLALAEATSLDVIFLDKSPEMLRCAAENIYSRDMCVRHRIIRSEVQQIPLDDASIDLVVSRGSVPFWAELATSFREILRVLKPGGRAYIGGGLGPPELRESLRAQVHKHNPEWHKRGNSIPHRENSEYREALLAAGIGRFTITRSDVGMWIEFGRE